MAGVFAVPSVPTPQWVPTHIYVVNPYRYSMPEPMFVHMSRIPGARGVYMYHLGQNTVLLSTEYPTCYNYIIMEHDQPVLRQAYMGPVVVQFIIRPGKMTIQQWCTACRSSRCNCLSLKIES